MNVRELLAHLVGDENEQAAVDLLNGVSPDAVVVLSSDGEGNSYDTAHSIATDMVFCREDYEGRIGYTELTPELEEDGFGEEDLIAPEIAEAAVVIWP
jgi:hypothetical protein